MTAAIPRLFCRPLVVVAIIALLTKTPVGAQSVPERKYYTPARIATALENAGSADPDLDWADVLYSPSASQNSFIRHGDGVPDYYTASQYGDAEAFLALDDESLWYLQPDTAIYRHVPDNLKNYSPVNGYNVPSHLSSRLWALDPAAPAHRYKVQDRSTGEWYPKNDYYAYFLSGIDPATKRFNKDLANPAYLQGEGGSTHIDSGYGDGFQVTINGSAPSIYPVRIYSHFVYCAYTIPLLRSYSQGALLIQDAEERQAYARAGLILLARLAFVYPDYRAPAGSDPDRRGWVYEAAPGGTVNGGGGAIATRIWETFCFEEIAYAYDALRPFIYDPALASVITFCSQHGVRNSNGSGVATPAELDDYIRRHLLQAGMYAITQSKISGNYGMHQAAAAAAAVAFGEAGTATAELPNSKTMADFLYSGFESLKYLMPNYLLNDGAGHESVGYNDLKLDLVRTNKLMEVLRANHPAEIPASQYPDAFADAKARSMFDYFIQIAVLDRFNPGFGDTGGTRLNPSRITAPNFTADDEFFYAWQKYELGATQQSPYLMAARAAGAWPVGDLFEPYPSAAVRSLNPVLPSEKIKENMRLLGGYGVAVLEQGRGDNRRSLMQNATTLMGHRQHDPLSLEFYANNLSLLPDIGYPSSAYRWQFDSHSMAANTVTVDETRPTMGSLQNANGTVAGYGPGGAIGRLFAQAGPLQVVAHSFDAYPPGYDEEKFRDRFELLTGAPTGAANCTLYERLDCLVEIDSRHSYVVDLFSVNGGSQHDLSWHSVRKMPADDSSPAFSFASQGGGTLAGPSVGRYQIYTDSWNRSQIGENDPNVNLPGAFPSYMINVKRAALDRPARFTWATGLPEGDRLRIHLVPVDGAGQTDMIRGTAGTPSLGDLEYLLVRRSNAAGARTRFLSILEHYQGATPKIQSVSLKSANPLKVEIIHAAGKDHVTLGSPDGSSRTTARRDLGVRLERWQKTGLPDTDTTSKVTDVQVGSPTGSSAGYFTGTIVSCTPADRRINITLTEDLKRITEIGRTLRIFNADRSSLYRIVQRQENPSANPPSISLWLDRTPLLAKGPVTAVEGSKVVLGADMKFANGNDHNGSYGLHAWQPRDFVAGAVLGDGGNARRLLGSVQKGTASPSVARTDLYLQAGQPAPSYGSGDVPIWDFGTGDSVEIAEIVYHAGQQIPTGQAKSIAVTLPSPPLGTTKTVVEVMAWMKLNLFANHACTMKVKWDGALLSIPAGTIPASFEIKDGTSRWTSSSSGYSVPICPDPCAITTDSLKYFRDVEDIYDLVRLKFEMAGTPSGNHTITIEHGSAISYPLIVGSVHAYHAGP